MFTDREDSLDENYNPQQANNALLLVQFVVSVLQGDHIERRTSKL